MKTYKMLRSICTVLMLLFSISLYGAQVYIPDPNFRAYLQKNFPYCMTGIDLAYLETTCTGVVSATGLYVDGLNISDLTGAEYFTSLTGLHCNSNQLTFLPKLSPTLAELSCNDNQLTSLPPLTGIVNLFCERNQLTSLSNLPSTIKSLGCSNNNITSISGNFQSLTILYCSNNLLTELPVFSNNLRFLVCENNQISMLPAELSASLTLLLCSSNLISYLPPLPESLSTFWCENNKIGNMPDLPSGLNQLLCRNNQIPSLPFLPDSLCKILATGNFFDCLPNRPAACSSITADLPFECYDFVSTSVDKTTVCSGASLTVTFVTSGTFNAGNIFTAQLINPYDPAFTPVNIGSLSGTSSGTIWQPFLQTLRLTFTELGLFPVRLHL